MIMKAKPPQFLVGNKNTNSSENSFLKKNFVSEADTHVPLNVIDNGEIHSSKYPWDGALVRDDVVKLFNLRLSEPDWLKLKFIADKSDVSMHTLCLDVLIPFINRRLKKIITDDNQNAYDDNQNTG